MIRDRNDMPARPLELDLTGPDGNVFVLMGYAKKLARWIYDDEHPDIEQHNEISDLLEGLGAEYEEFQKIKLGDFITQRMMESDYEHALNIFETYFGDHVILYR